MGLIYFHAFPNYFHGLGQQADEISGTKELALIESDRIGKYDFLASTIHKYFSMVL